MTDEFLDGYYGRAGRPLRRYIDALHDALGRSGAGLDIYEPPAVHADGPSLGRRHRALYDSLFDKAEAAAAGDPAALARVRTARLPLMYASSRSARTTCSARAASTWKRAGRFEARPAKVRLLEEFAARCEAGGVRTLNESGSRRPPIATSVRRFIDVQVEGNLAFRKPVAADPPPAAKYARGALSVLTDGVRGAADFKVHWLGWEGVDFRLILDLGKPVMAREVALSTLSDFRSWILHPASVGCSVSADGLEFRDVGVRTLPGDHREEDIVRVFSWTEDMAAPGLSRPASASSASASRATKRLPDWHTSAGGLAWVFVDEIVVR